ncbi:hypothetical protein G7054_g8989 [Neopestalotiopsis clavispora]|nr:hypothetical protein G7054_g8989 [Neopestalotiopsis clavispora]
MAIEMSSINKTTSNQADEVISTQLSYLKVDPRHKQEKPYRVLYSTQGLFRQTNTINEDQPVLIRNFRSIQNSESLDQFGFSVKTLQSSLGPQEFENKKKVEQWYYPEVKQLLQQTFPEAANIEILDHGIRKRERQADDAIDVMAPTNVVHIDYAGDSFYKTCLETSKASTEKCSRVVLVNLWKCLQGPGNDWPLALCDRRTVNYDIDIIDEDEVLHEWYWFKDLQEDEVIMFQQFDTNIEGGGGAPHAGFLNPSTAKGAAPRKSIEIRAFIYFD